MSNIDDIFKKGLDGKGLEYSDGHWAGMEQMLDSQKVGIFARYKAYFGVLALLAVSSCSLFYFLCDGTDSNTVNTPTAVSEITSKNSEVNNAENLSSINTPVKNIESKTEGISTDENQSLSSASSTPAATQLSGTKQIVYFENDGMKIQRMKDPLDNGIEIPEPIILSDVAHSPSALSALQVEVTRPEEVRKLIMADFRELITANSVIVSDLEVDVTGNIQGKLEYLPNINMKKMGLYISPYVGYVNYRKNEVLPEVESDLNNNLGKSKAIGSINYGINVGLERGRWRVISGLGVLSLREQTNYTRTIENYDYTTAPRISNSNFTTTPRGTRVALVEQRNVDSTLNRRIESICEECEVQFNYISIPLQVQYTFGRGKLKYFADAGVKVSLLQNSKGDYASINIPETDSSNISNVEILDLQKSEFVRKSLLHANASVGARYWLSPKWSVWTSYGYSLGLNSMFGTYEQKPNIQNLRVGLEFKLR